MPTTTYFGLTYVTPFDPAYVDLWGAVLNTLHTTWDAALGCCVAAGSIVYPEIDKDYGIIPSIRFPCTVESLKIWTDASTATANAKINSTSITSLSAVAVTTSKTRTASTGAKTMAADDDLYLRFSAIGATATILYYSFWINRTGAGTA